MSARTWITAELAFAGQVLDNQTENCAIHANETFNRLEKLVAGQIKVGRQAGKPSPAHEKVADLENSKAKPSSVSLAAPKSEIVLQKRSCFSPTRSPVHKKLALAESPQRRLVAIPGSHTARRAASRSINTTFKPRFGANTTKASRSVSPAKTQNLQSPRRPLNEVSNVSTKATGGNTEKKPAVVANQSPRKKERELTGLARLLLPTSASAARTHKARNLTENCDTPMSHHMEQDGLGRKPRAAATRVNSAGSVVSDDTASHKTMVGAAVTEVIEKDNKPTVPKAKLFPAKPKAPKVECQISAARAEASVPTLEAPKPTTVSKPAPGTVNATSETMPPPSMSLPKLRIPLRPALGQAADAPPQRIQVVGLPPVMQAEATLPDISDSSEGSILQEWAYTPEVAERIRRQINIDPLSVFGPIKPVEMTAIFKRKLRPRTSSAVWDVDGLTPQERQAYQENMGFKP